MNLMFGFNEDEGLQRDWFITIKTLHTHLNFDLNVCDSDLKH